jgi:hypothetical protein
VGTSAFAVRQPVRRFSSQTLLLAAGAVLIAILVGLLAVQPQQSLLHEAAPVLLVPVAVWMFFSERYEVTLSVFLVYLGVFDGVAKLTSGSTVATLGRDVLLYSIALGAIARLVLRSRPVKIPPLAGLVFAWVAVCLVQLANPGNSSTLHAAAGLRQHLEFVPLFFFGYYLLRSERRVAGLCALLVIVAALNGVVGLIQAELTPAQLASWGPGYRALEFATSSTYGVARVFYEGGQAHVRPPGLGGEDGFGGVLGLIALPCGIALISGARKKARSLFVLLPALALVLVGIVTSQSRFAVVGAVVAVLVFLLTTATSRRGVGVVAVVAVIGFVGYFVLANFSSSTATRYSTITPTHVLGAATSDKSTSFDAIPHYLSRFPLGAGLGSVGPAQNAVGGSAQGRSLNGETEFTFLIVETGIPGLLVMTAFFAAVLRTGFAMRRLADRKLQRLLMAMTAIMVALLGGWFVNAVTSDSPTAPMLWLGAGCLAYWYGQVGSGRLLLRPRLLQANQRSRPSRATPKLADSGVRT